MKYNGIELKEETESQIFSTPQKMLVWDNEPGDTTPLLVHAIINSRNYPVIASNSSWKHCAKIPESKLATNHQLAQWLAQGNGEMRMILSISTYYAFAIEDENNPVSDVIYVRKWTDTEWHKPTREYLGLED